MFGNGSPEHLGLRIIIMMAVYIGIPLVVIALKMALTKSRQRRQLSHNNGMFLTYCAKCGKEATQGSSFCQHCGEKLPDVHDATQVPAASSVITNEDYASFVGIKAEKYLPKFKRFSVHEMDNFRVTWHWPAFFVPFCWMLYRKLYGWAIIAFFIEIIPYIGLFLRVVWAITANYIYYKHAKKILLEIKQLHSSPETQRALRAAAGGVGHGGFLVYVSMIAIIGILAAISLPMMRMQEVKARLSFVLKPCVLSGTLK